MPEDPLIRLDFFHSNLPSLCDPKTSPCSERCRKRKYPWLEDDLPGPMKEETLTVFYNLSKKVRKAFRVPKELEEIGLGEDEEIQTLRDRRSLDIWLWNNGFNLDKLKKRFDILYIQLRDYRDEISRMSQEDKIDFLGKNKMFYKLSGTKKRLLCLEQNF